MNTLQHFKIKDDIGNTIFFYIFTVFAQIFMVFTLIRYYELGCDITQRPVWGLLILAIVFQVIAFGYEPWEDFLDFLS